MNRDEALNLAELVDLIAPWLDGLYALPVDPANQQCSNVPYLVTLSSGLLRLYLSEPADLALVIQNLQPSVGLTGFPLIDRNLLHEWIVAQLALPDQAERICGTGELETYVHDPKNHADRILLPAQVTIAPVVECLAEAAQAKAPVFPEVIVTAAWDCPICEMALPFSRHFCSETGYRLFAAPVHPAIGTEKRCPANVWVEARFDTQEGTQREMVSAQVWHLVHRSLPVPELATSF